MSESLVRRQLEESLDLSSLRDVLKADEVVMLLIDTSGSMGAGLQGTENKRRIDALREVVATIKSQGSVPMIAFGGPYDAQVRFVDNVPEPYGGTPLHIAIPMAKTYGASRVVVISDGCPDLTDQCMIEARTFGGRIDVVFVGDKGKGEAFLAALARLTGGSSSVGDLRDVKQLSRGVIGLLEGDTETKSPIQGEGFVSVDEPVEADDDEEEEDDDDAE